MIGVLARVALAVASALVSLAAARAADTVCVGTSSEGLVCLAGEGLRQFHRRDGKLPDDRVTGLADCGDRIAIAAGEYIVDFDGNDLDPPNRVGRGIVDRVACDREGRRWASSASAVSLWEGGSWRHFELRDIAPPGLRHPRVGGLAAGPQGSAWITLSEGVVAHYKGEKWVVHRQGSGFRERHAFGPILVDRNGSVRLPYARGIYTLKGERWELLPAIGPAHDIVEDAGSRLWLTSGARIEVHEGGKRRTIESDQNVRAIAVDDAGVLWAATEFGLARHAAGKWQSRQMHNSELPDNDLMSIVALGRGLELPSPVAPARGRLAGRTQWSDGSPIGLAEVQLCAVRVFDHGVNRSPCEDQPLAARTWTDREGNFAIANLAPANYYFLVQPRGQRRWIRFATGAERFKIRPGADHAVGAIVIDVKQREALRP